MWLLDNSSLRQLVDTPNRDSILQKMEQFLANMNARYMLALVRLSVCLSVCLSVTFVHSTVPVEIYGNISTPFDALAIRWHSRNILQRSSQGNHSVGGDKRKRGSQI